MSVALFNVDAVCSPHVQSPDWWASTSGLLPTINTSAAATTDDEDEDVQKSIASLSPERIADLMDFPFRFHDHTQSSPPSAAMQSYPLPSASICQKGLDWAGDLYSQQWVPCSHGQSVEAYLSQEQHGPLLRTLCVEWQQMGTPSLDSIEQLQHAQRQAGQCNVLPYDLAALALSQEQVIVRTISKALNSSPDQPIVVDKTFDTFAGQLGLFSMIKAELIVIRQRNAGHAELNKEQVYQQIWQTHLRIFDRGRTSCHNANAHICLGELIWGKAYQLPLDVLQYSYAGYLMQMKTGQQQQAQPAVVPGSPGMHSWLDLSSSSQSDVSDSRYASTPATSESTNDVASFSSPSSAQHKLPAPRASAAWLRQATTFGFDPFSKPPSYDDSMHAAAAPPSLVPDRRGALSPTHGAFLQDMLLFCHSAGIFNDVGTPSQGGSEHPTRAESPEQMAMAEEDMRPPSSMRPGNAAAAQTAWRTKLWTLSVAPPVRTYSLEISPKGTSTACHYEGLFLPLRPLPSQQPMLPHLAEPDEATVTVDQAMDVSPPSSRSSSSGMSSPPLRKRDVSPISSMRNAQSGADEVLFTPQLLSLPTPPKRRPGMHQRSESARSNLSILSAGSAGSTTKQRLRDAGRARSQRHHVRLMAQRATLQDAVERLEEVMRTLWRMGCASTTIALTMMKALTEVSEEAQATDAPSSYVVSAIEEDKKQLCNQRKKDSKRKMRNVDRQYVQIMMRVAAAIVEVPLAKLATLPAMDQANTAGPTAAITAVPSTRALNLEETAQNAVLQVWLGFRQGWSDLVMAEKRFFPTGPPPPHTGDHALVSMGAVIQLLQMGLHAKEQRHVVA